MKRCKIVILMIFLLLAAAVTPTLADGSYNQVFESLKGSDGWLAEGLLSELEREFIKDPEAFLDELQKQDKDIQQIVLQSFAAWAVTDTSANNTLARAIESVKDNPKAKDLLDFCEQAMVENANQFPMEPTYIEGFDIDGVKETISFYRENKFPFDEEFDALLVNYYLLDGRLLAKTISEMELTAEEISLLTERMKNVSCRVDPPDTPFENEVVLRLTDEEEQIYQKMVDTLESQDSEEEAQQTKPNTLEHVKNPLLLLAIIIIFILFFLFWKRQKNRW